MTDSEAVLWSRLRGKQFEGIQFYRQKPIGNFIVDFYAPKAKLVLEIDGSQHLEEEGIQKDQNRDRYLAGLGLKILRFSSRDVLVETDSVLEIIFQTIGGVESEKSP